MISLTWQQLAASIALVSFFSFLTYSRRNPFVLQPILTIGSVILVLGTVIWNFTVITTAWFGSERMFEDPNVRSLAKALQYGCFCIAAVVLISAVMGLIWLRDFSLRQRVCYLLASLFLAVPLRIIALSPSRLLSAIEGISGP